jgi:cytoskeletal protein CcmA (bactofilin family)
MFGKRPTPPSVKLSQLASLVAEGVEIVGDIQFSDGMRIDGRVKGNVVGRASGKAKPLLVLSDKGCIEGSVRCGDAVINGTVTGDLHVEHFLELQANARVDGTIRYRQLRIDLGASVQGQLRRSTDEETAADNVVELRNEAAS